MVAGGIYSSLTSHSFVLTLSQYKNGCAVSLNYKSDWAPKTVKDIPEGVCRLTRGDVAVALLGIADKCTTKGRIGGKRPFGRGKCEGELEFIVPKGGPPTGH